MSNVLVGKVLTGVELINDKESIVFVTADRRIKVDAYGDCCSHSWIEHIELPALGFPATVLSVEEQGEVKGEETGDWDYLRYYITKIVTDRGEIIIDYRNSSNGYYGGMLEWPHE